MKRIVYNGQIIAKADTLGEEYIRLKPILRYINKIGSDIGQVFKKSIQNLFATVVSTSLGDVSFLASLCIDIMDRNLYERADDCRWWALNSTFKTTLTHEKITEYDRNKLTKILGYINSLYTVYTCLFLFDKTGKIIAVSNPEQNAYIGRVLDDEYIKSTLKNSNESKYFVSPFEKSHLYNNKPTYIYGASITDVSDSKKTVGGISIVFDSEFQFKNMMEDALQNKENSFAVFTDRNGTIISSTNEKLISGEKFNIPHEVFDVKNGSSHSDVIVYEECYYSVGCVCSSSYREYKSTDGYQNDVLSFVLEKLADCEQSGHSQTKEISVEQSEIPFTSSDKQIKLATFLIDGRLMGNRAGVYVLEASGTQKNHPLCQTALTRSKA